MGERVNALIIIIIIDIMCSKANAEFSYSKNVMNVHDEIKSFMVSKERLAENNAKRILCDFESRRRIMSEYTPDSVYILALSFQYTIKSDNDVITAFVATNNICIGAFSNTNVIFVTSVPICIEQICGTDIVERVRNYSYVYPVGFDDNVRTIYVTEFNVVNQVQADNSLQCFRSFDIPFNWVDKTRYINPRNCWGDGLSIETFKDIARIINIVLLKMNSMLPKYSPRPV